MQLLPHRGWAGAGDFGLRQRGRAELAAIRRSANAGRSAHLALPSRPRLRSRSPALSAGLRRCSRNARRVRASGRRRGSTPLGARICLGRRRTILRAFDADRAVRSRGGAAIEGAARDVRARPALHSGLRDANRFGRGIYRILGGYGARSERHRSRAASTSSSANVRWARTARIANRGDIPTRAKPGRWPGTRASSSFC